MTDIVMDAEQHPAPAEGTDKCSQPGCIRPAPHEGMRHRYAPTKDLQPEPEPEPVTVPETDERPFNGPVESRPRNHALTLIDEKKGLYVAWDMCAGAGGCGQHITRCVCSTGPKMPDYVQRWRDAQFPIGDPAPARDVAVDVTPDTDERSATHICDSCGELLYLLDTLDGKRAYTVEGDKNYCTVDDAGIHSARDITQDDRDANPDWFGGEDDEDEQFEHLRRTDSNDITGPDVEQTTVETESTNDNIDPEVGF